jgi:hypothetical protein
MLFTTIILTSTFVLAAGQAADELAPQATKLEPKTGKPGTIVVIKGVSLDKTKVDEVYLTDHRFDIKVKVLEQTEDTLKIRIPPFVKPGRQQLLLLTGGKIPTYLEQPVWVLVESVDDKDKEVVAEKKDATPKETTSGDGNKPDKPDNQ